MNITNLTNRNQLTAGDLAFGDVFTEEGYTGAHCYIKVMPIYSLVELQDRHPDHIFVVNTKNAGLHTIRRNSIVTISNNLSL